MATISVVINTLNEGEILPRAVASVKSFADEIVVTDMESDDKTPEIAKKLGAKVYFHKRLSYVEPARNFGVDKAKSEWVLILDPDEEVPPLLSKKIKMLVTKSQADYYRISRKNIIFGKWLKHSRFWPDYNIRLFKKGSVSWNEVIHGVPMTQGAGGEVEAQEDLAILHRHYDSIEQFVERMNRYTTNQAKMRVKEGYKFLWKDIISKPLEEFFSRYFFGYGYLDGIHGLAVSALQGFSELVLYLKIWQIEKFVDEEIKVSDVISVMNIEEKSLHFWQNDALYKETGNLVARIKRKLRI